MRSVDAHTNGRVPRRSARSRHADGRVAPEAMKTEGPRVGIARDPFPWLERLARPGDEPWPDPVDGADLLVDIGAFASRFVIAPPPALTAIAVWALYAHVHDAFGTSPILAVLSPVKRCGKTNVLGALFHLCPRAVLSSNLTGPALYRTVEAERPTLLVDEADSFLTAREELRGIVNSGHTRAGAFILRASGPGNRPKRYSTWAPKALAAIGRLPSTIEDRSVVIRLQRKRTSEATESLDAPGVEAAAGVLRRRAARWGRDQAKDLSAARPERIDGLHDRANDSWRPLLAVAEACGPWWARLARRAAVELSEAVEETDPKEMLLADLREVFTARGAVRLPTAQVLAGLHAMEERPWAGGGRPALNAERLAGMLRDFGVRSRSFSGVVRGYDLANGLGEAFERYLPPTGPGER